MKKPAENIFELIRSLNKTEKAYFKKYSALHERKDGNNYVLIFDAIERQKNYNEEVLLQILKGNNLKRRFAVAKSYLYNQVLYSLESYNHSIYAEMRSLLNHIEILFGKSLFSHCLKQIHKAKKLALKYELFEEMLPLLRWEYRIANKKLDMQHCKKVSEEEKEILIKFNNQRHYREIATDFSGKYQQRGIRRNLKSLAEAKRILKTKLLKDETKALSIRAKQYFYDCHFLYGIMNGDFKSSQSSSRKMTDMYHKNPEMISVNPTPYLNSINNFLLSSNGLKQYNEMQTYLKKLEEIRKKFKAPSDKATAFFYLYHLLNYYLSTGLFKEAEEDTKRIEQELPEHEAKLNQLQKIILYMNIAQIYFGQENYKRCLVWLNKIIAFGEMKLRTDIECSVRLFYLIVRYEMKSDKELMISLFKSTYRFLYKHQHMYKFEAAIMNFIRQNTVKESEERSLRKHFIKLKSQLETLAKISNERHALDYFDFISWLESKIENKLFAEIVKRSAKNSL